MFWLGVLLTTILVVLGLGALALWALDKWCDWIRTL